LFCTYDDISYQNFKSVNDSENYELAFKREHILKYMVQITWIFTEE